MARDLDSILKELDAGYNPSRQQINDRLTALPGQADAEIAGLKATQGEAFDNILSGARQRGIGFSGIPIGEQAKYTSSQFLPAVARVRQSQNDVQGSLLDSLNKVNLEQRNNAIGIRTGELDREEQARQFNEQLAAQERARAAASRGTTFKLPAGGNANLAGGAPVNTDPVQQAAFNDVNTRITGQSDAELRSDYLATASSAKYGNAKDLYKLKIYRQLRPDLFRFPYEWEEAGGVVLSNRPTF